MQLGLVTYNWGKDWDLPTLIKMCEQTGFRGVELRSTHKHGVEPALGSAERADVAKRFGDSMVELVGLGSACEYHSPDPAVVKKNIEETKAFINLCHDCGGTGVKVRPNAFSRLVTNLAANAWRHAANVRIEARNPGRFLAVIIDDDGPGIPENMREEVFKPFFRLDEARNLDASGTGLGLAIARDIARGHGGDVTLSDSPMGGLRATVRVPV